MKICRKCKNHKDVSLFSKNKNFEDGYALECKQCKKEYDAKNYIIKKKEIIEKSIIYQNNNKKKILEYQKTLYETNKKEILSYHKKYRKKNKEKIKISINKWIKYKKQNDPFYNVFRNMRTRIYMAIIKSKGIKSKKTLELIGCTIKECKQHLEKQFKPEMTWENHGKIWEIDHIKPCASFDLTNIIEQEKCFHYTNLQPLFKTTEIAESFGYQNEIGNRNKYKNNI